MFRKTTSPPKRWRTPMVCAGLIAGSLCWAISMSACSMRMNWPEHTVDVSIHTPERTEWTDANHTQHATELLLTVDMVELIPCKPAQPQGYATRLLDGLVPAAQAHGVSTETKLANHYILSMIGPRTQTSYGQWTPTPAEYCRIELLIASADDDAFGATTHPEMTGHSIGVYATQTDNAQDASMYVRTTGKLSKTITLEPPLVLPSDGDSLNKHITIELSLTQPMPSITNTMRSEDAIDQQWLLDFQRALDARVILK